MRILGIIPARFASTRFPGKPLVDIGAKTMLQRVYERASEAQGLDKVIVATDDNRIVKHVKSFGGNVVLTASTHQSGTDRCAEVAKKYKEFDAIINIQGDEPFIDPMQIDSVAALLNFENTSIATLVKKITNTATLKNPNIPKVILGDDGNVLYFSRAIIPFQRGVAPKDWLKHSDYYKHIGIYGYQIKTLLKIAQLQVSALEKAEALEQLRWLESGFKIRAAITDLESIAVDTPEDLELLKKAYKKLI